MLALYLFSSLPIYQRGLINTTGEQWRDSINEKQVIQIQYKYECCGWSNITDNGIYPCPINFDSCCLDVFENYIAPRFKEIYLSAILMLAVFFISIIALSVYARISGIDSLIEAIFFLGMLNEEDNNN